MSTSEGKLDVTSIYSSIDDLEKSGEYMQTVENPIHEITGL